MCDNSFNYSRFEFRIMIKSLIKSGLKFGTIAEKMLIPVKELRWYNDKNLRRVWKIDNDCQQNKNKPSMS